MAFEQLLGQLVSVPVSESFAALQFTFVQINSSGQLIPPSGAGVICDGVIQDDNPDTVAPVASQVAISGISKVVSGASVNEGDLVMTDSSGRAVTCTGSNHILGRALQGNGGIAGIIIPVLLFKGGHASSGV
jgi:hypothetical protein